MSRGASGERRRIACALVALIGGLHLGRATAQPAGGPAAAAGAAAPSRWPVTDELWDRPRSADAVRTIPAVRAAVRALQAAPAETVLVIRHGRGQNPAWQAEELRQWLIALALEPQRLQLAEDAKAGSSVVLELFPQR